MASQAAIDIGKVRVDEVHHAPVLANDGPEKQPRLLAHRLSQRLVEAGKNVGVRGRAREKSRLQPLLSEVLRQGVRPWVAQHPLNLSGEHLGVRQAAIAGQLEQLGIRHAAPEKIGEPGSELIGRDRVNRRRVFRLGIELDTKEKMRRGERRLEDHPEGVLDGALVVNHSPAKLDETLKLTILKGAPVRPGYKALDGLADVAQMRTPILHQGAHDHPGRLSRRLLQFKKPDLEPVDKQIAIAAKGGVGVARAVIIIEQGYAEAVLALIELDPGLVYLRGGGNRLDLRLTHRLAVNSEAHPDRLRTRLAAISPGSQDIVTGLRGLVNNGQFVVGVDTGGLVIRSSPANMFVRGPVARGGLLSLVMGESGAPDGQGGKQRADNVFSRVYVFFQQQRRQRQHISDVVKAVAHIVSGKVIRQLDLESREISHRARVFIAAEPANRRATRVDRSIAIKAVELRIDGGAKGQALSLGWLPGLFRRHLTQDQHAADRLPFLTASLNRLGVASGRKIEPALRLLAFMATHAIAVEELGRLARQFLCGQHRERARAKKEGEGREGAAPDQRCGCWLIVHGQGRCLPRAS